MDAHYHLHAEFIKRGHADGDDSAVGTINYVVRSGSHAGLRSELVFCQSGNMPGWAAATHVADLRRAALGYWTACDARERANGLLALHIDFALPDALSEGERIRVAVKYAKELSSTAVDVGHPLPWTLAIHRKADANRRLHDHAHVVLSARCNDGVERDADHWFRRANRKAPEKGGAPKTRVFQPKRWLAAARKLWEKVGNAALMKAASLERLDCRSYQERGITRVPGVHLGPYPSSLKRSGKSSRRVEQLKRIEEENEQRLAHDRARAELEACRRRIRDLELTEMLIESGVVEALAQLLDQSKSASQMQLERDTAAESGSVARRGPGMGR